VRDDDDRVALLELEHQVLDRRGGDRVQGRARLVHEDHLGLDRHRAGDAQALLLAAGHAERVRLEAVLDLVPQRRPAQRALDDLVHVPFIPSTRGPKAMLSKIDLGNGLGFWKTIPMTLRTWTGSMSLA
jgi:hypothetical protein